MIKFKKERTAKEGRINISVLLDEKLFGVVVVESESKEVEFTTNGTQGLTRRMLREIDVGLRKIEVETGRLTLMEESVFSYKLLVDPNTDEIVTLVSTASEFTVGQPVQSNGRIETEGKMGTIEKICRPGEKGLTSDVLVVRWHDDGSESYLKPKDIYPVS